jgi:hypothetical protein
MASARLAAWGRDGVRRVAVSDERRVRRTSGVEGVKVRCCDVSVQVRCRTRQEGPLERQGSVIGSRRGAVARETNRMRSTREEPLETRAGR